LIGAFKYLEPPQGKMLRLLSLGEKKSDQQNQALAKKHKEDAARVTFHK
jgi:hypothetical protein